jgi:hypothetical protein
MYYCLEYRIGCITASCLLCNIIELEIERHYWLVLYRVRSILVQKGEKYTAI